MRSPAPPRYGDREMRSPKKRHCDEDHGGRRGNECPGRDPSITLQHAEREPERRKHHGTHDERIRPQGEEPAKRHQSLSRDDEFRERDADVLPVDREGYSGNADGGGSRERGECGRREMPSARGPS